MPAKLLASSNGKSTLSAPRFAPGMLLQHDDLEQLAEFPRDLSRMLFRALVGCGVVCGLVVKIEEPCDKIVVTVAPGLSLDCTGNPIYVPVATRVQVPIDSSKTDENKSGAKKKTSKPYLWVVLCRSTKRTSPRPTNCGCDGDDSGSVCSRQQDWFEIRVLDDLPSCACGCAGTDPKQFAPAGQDDDKQDNQNQCHCSTSSCYDDHYHGVCGCKEDEHCDCDCDCVVLARLYRDGDPARWYVDHSVRRFIRPVLMRDPQVDDEIKVRKAKRSPLTTQERQNVT